MGSLVVRFSDRVLMTELAERLTRRRAFLAGRYFEVEHDVIHTEPDIGRTGAPSFGVNVEVIDEAV